MGLDGAVVVHTGSVELKISLTFFLLLFSFK